MEAEGAEVCAVKCDDFVAERCKCAAYLAVAALMHGDNPGMVVAIVQAFQVEFAWSVGQRDAVIINHLTVQWLQGLVQSYFVFFDFYKAWVRHAVCEVTVIREQ